MLCRDIIKLISYYADYDTTLMMLDLYPWLNIDDNFWKTKISIQQPDKIYLNFWNGRENYLSTSKFIILTHYRWEFPHYLYEYDEHTLLVSKISSCESEESYEPIDISVEKQFILLDDIKQLASFDNIEDALIFIKYTLNGTRCYLADMADFVPFFKKYKNLRTKDENPNILRY